MHLHRLITCAMKCEKCQNQDATVHITDFDLAAASSSMDSGVGRRHLCKVCADMLMVSSSSPLMTGLRWHVLGIPTDDLVQVTIRIESLNPDSSVSARVIKTSNPFYPIGRQLIFKGSSLARESQRIGCELSVSCTSSELAEILL